MARTKAAGDKEPKRPAYWDKMVSVAYLLLTGLTQSLAADGAGCSERTIRTWKQHHMWPDAIAQARARWLVDTDSEAMAALGDLVRGRSEKSVLFYADRRIPELAPPKQRVEHGGEVVALTPEQARERLLDKLKGDA